MIFCEVRSSSERFLQSLWAPSTLTTGIWTEPCNSRGSQGYYRIPWWLGKEYRAETTWWVAQGLWTFTQGSLVWTSQKPISEESGIRTGPGNQSGCSAKWAAALRWSGKLIKDGIGSFRRYSPGETRTPHLVIIIDPFLSFWYKSHSQPGPSICE